MASKNSISFVRGHFLKKKSNVP